MNGIEVERLLSLIEANSNLNRDVILRYVAEHREEILASLRETGEAEIPVEGGEKIVIRLAVA